MHPPGMERKEVSIISFDQILEKKKAVGGGTKNVYLESHTGFYTEYKLTTYKNFMDTPPLVVPNVKQNDGVYSFKLDTSLYTNIMIVSVDQTGASQKLIDIDRKDPVIPPLKTRKIALDKPLSSEQCFQETRNAVCLTPKETHIIEDITSVEYQTIDSIQKVGQVIQELLRLKHKEDQAFTTSTWLYNWNNADLEFKNKKYSMMMCNEFNFFLYFKDREYFNLIVKPSIAAKIEKTLIDYFLLEEYDKFEEYKQVSVYDSFNALEQCLLIAVINMKDHETAKKLADQFLNKAKLVETKTAKKNQKFDTVLLMKILESEEMDEEDDEEEKEEGGAPKLYIAKKGKKQVKRQRSMSLSSNSSVEEMNWAQKQKYDSDSEGTISSGGEGDYDEGEDYE